MKDVNFDDDVNKYGGLDVSENESLDSLLEEYNRSKGLSNSELLVVESYDSSNKSGLVPSIKKFFKKFI